MAWLAVDKDGTEVIMTNKPEKVSYYWSNEGGEFANVPQGTIEKIIGRVLTWDDEPVEI